MGYLTRLTLALAAGAGRLPGEVLEGHRAFLLGRQNGDGGWGGREGGSDPYYTTFALRGLWISGGVDRAVAVAAGDFLRRQMSRRMTVVDLMSLIFAAAILEIAAGEVVIGEDEHWSDRMVDLMQSMRTEDGGFAKTPEGRAGSTYQTFLSTLCFELLQRPVPEPDRVAAFLDGQRREDGGYLEIRAAKRAGVNPTAAAVGTLRCIDRFDGDAFAGTADFLLSRQNADGGFSANTRIPFSDLLSTFTGLWTLVDGGVAPDRSVSKGAGRYAESMSRLGREAVDGVKSVDGGGGFVGFELDEVTDVEYTFYGLGVMSLVGALDER